MILSSVTLFFIAVFVILLNLHCEKGMEAIQNPSGLQQHIASNKQTNKNQINIHFFSSVVKRSERQTAAVQFVYVLNFYAASIKPILKGSQV